MRIEAPIPFFLLVKIFFSCPEQLYKSICWSVGPSGGPSVMFVKNLPLEYLKVIKTYLPTYLWDRSDSCDSSDSSDSSDNSDKKSYD